MDSGQSTRLLGYSRTVSKAFITGTCRQAGGGAGSGGLSGACVCIKCKQFYLLLHPPAGPSTISGVSKIKLVFENIDDRVLIYISKVNIATIKKLYCNFLIQVLETLFVIVVTKPRHCCWKSKLLKVQKNEIVLLRHLHTVNKNK